MTMGQPPHGTDWKSPPDKDHGGFSFPRARLQQEITAGGVGLSRLRKKVRTNFR